MSLGYKIFARSNKYRDHFDETFYLTRGEMPCQEEMEPVLRVRDQEQEEDTVDVHQ